MVQAAGDYAVLLNPNARRVSRAITDRIGEIVDPADLYVSADYATAPEIVHGIVEQGYDTVFTGGGDGTVTRFINLLPSPERTPRIGILKLGTGNAMAEIVSSGKPLIDLQTYAANPSDDTYQLGLCESEGTRFAFGGLGIDAAILNDYRYVKARFGSGPLRPLAQNLAGYLAAVFGITAPRMLGRWLRRQQTRVRITNLDDKAYTITGGRHGGRAGSFVRAGETLFEGPAKAVCFGTCPYYGYGLKALPFAGVDPSYFHLRVVGMSMPYAVAHLPALWNGTLRHERNADFHARRVHIEFSEDMPYQLAGEAMGHRRDVTVAMSDWPVDLVRFI